MQKRVWGGEERSIARRKGPTASLPSFFFVLQFLIAEPRAFVSLPSPNFQSHF